MLVHRSSIADDDSPVLLQLLRDQLGKTVYPVHRLDRPTSGVVVFAHSPEVTRSMQEILTDGRSTKCYTALVRGWLNEPQIWDRDVKNDKGKLKEATTRFVPLEKLELPLATDRYPTARFSLIEAYPATGRWHQIRQHLAQMRHYIINDRVHGDGKQNRIVSEQLSLRELFLHATTLTFPHPVTGLPLCITAPFPDHWAQLKEFAKKEQL